MRVDLLYFDGCPSWQEALKNMQAALAAEGLQAELHLIRVDDDVEAARLKFLGLPSFRVNGSDLWPEQRTRYNLSCRVYNTPQGLRGDDQTPQALNGVPTVEMLRAKLSTLSPTTPIRYKQE